METSILDCYVTSEPSDQNALNIFKTEWISKLPSEFGQLEAGTIPLFEDTRLVWMFQKLSGIVGQRVLELGPLEAGHTYMLEKYGAASVLAIEANTRAYLKCLIIKEVLQLNRSRFLCGDFIQYLRNHTQKFDTCIACGVLYHMQNPAELLSLIAQVSDQVFIWTHYYEKNQINANPAINSKFTHEPISSEYQGFKHSLYRQEYTTTLDSIQFCGGSATFSNWMSREDILACLQFFGFNHIEISFEDLNHGSGPCFALIAKTQLPNV
jgi:Protein of unknown function (DUF1698)